MANCIELFSTQATKEILRNSVVSNATKKKIIIETLRYNPRLLADIVSHFEPRLSVLTSENGKDFVLLDSFNSRVIQEANVEVVNEEEEIEEKRSKGFTTVEEKSKVEVANTLIAKQFIKSIPLISTSIAKNVDTVFNTKSFLNPTTTIQLLWKVYSNIYKNKIINYSGLENMIFTSIGNNELSDEENRILKSLHTFLFSEKKDGFTYKDMYGDTKKGVKSIKVNTLNPSIEIAEKNNNYLNILVSLVRSVNNESVLSFLTEDGVFEYDNSVVTEEKAVINSNVTKNLYEENEGTGNEKGSIDLKLEVIKNFSDRGITISDDKEVPGGYLINTYHTFYDLDGKPKAKQLVSIPFFLNTGTNKKEEIAVLGDIELKKANKITGPGFASMITNKEFISDLFKITGFDMVDRKLVTDFLLNPTNNVNSPALKQLWEININNIIVLLSDIATVQDAKIDEARRNGASSVYIYSPIPSARESSIKRDILDTANKIFSNPDNPENSIMNQSKTFYRVFRGSADVSKMNTFKLSPLINYRGTTKIAKQVIASKNIVGSTMQSNISGDMVNKNTIASNIDFLKKQYQDVKLYALKSLKDVNSTLSNLYGVITGFDTDKFISVFNAQNGMRNSSQQYSIEKIILEDGFNDKDTGVKKSQMSMNRSDINYLVHKRFIDSIVSNYNFVTRMVNKVLIFPSVASDKSKFAGFRINTGNHNNFPLTTQYIKNEDGTVKKVTTINIVKPGGLIYETIENESNHRTSARQGYISSWIDSGILDAVVVSKVKELVKNGSELSALNLLNENIISKNVPDGPFPLIVNKYYTGKKGEPFKLNNNYIKFMSENLDPNFFEKRKKELLTLLAVNHNESARIGLTFDKSYLDWLDNFVNPEATTTLKNNRTGETRTEGIVEKGIFYPKENNTIADDSYSIVNGEIVFNDNYNENGLIEKIVNNINPFEIAHFFAWNTIAPSINRQLYGEVEQYTEKKTTSKLSDLLKRAVQSTATYIRMAIDEDLTTPYIKTIPRYSKTIVIADEKGLSKNLITGKSTDVEMYDGGAFTNPLAQIFYQHSYGDIHGIYPEAAFKFIYGHTDQVTADNTLYKYAVHNLSEDVIKNGSPDVDVLMKLFLGSIAFDREVEFNVILPNGKQLYNQFSSSESLYHIYKYLQAENVDNLFHIMADFMVSSPNPATGRYDLKEKFVPQIVVTSSNKTGQSNVHTMESLRQRHAMSGDGTIPTVAEDFKVIDNNYLGVQLLATHDPENGTVSIFSQAITNSVLEGRTLGFSKDLFDALAGITETNLVDIDRVLVKGEIRFKDDKDSGLKKDMNFKDLKLSKLSFNANDFISGSSSKINTEEDFNLLKPSKRVDLFIRSLVLKSMEKDGKYNSTYKQVLSGVYSANDPQLKSKIISTINSYVDKKTVAISFPGGQFVAVPTQGLLGVWDVVNNITGKITSVLKSELNRKDENGNPLYNLLPGNTTEKARDLKWKEYVNGAGENFFNTTEYLKFQEIIKTGTPEQILTAQEEIISILEKGGYKITPAEFIMPYMHKKKFGILPGMQPDMVTEDFFFNQLMSKKITEGFTPEEIALQTPIFKEQAAKKYTSFQKSLEILVGRIPATGPQSIVVGKIVGFVETSQNAIYFPTEMMAIQGLDFDIDKSVVLSWNFDESGNFETSRANGLQNNAVQALYNAAGDVRNAIASDTAVTLKDLQAVRDSSPSTGLKDHPNLPYQIVEKKILTAEGKAMVGVFANGLKLYGLSFYAYITTNKAIKALGGKERTLKPLNIFGNTYNNIANTIVDKKNLKAQAWDFYSQLTNAATDNAKEMILGAIKANLQAGNLINTMVMYGVDSKEIFNYLDTPAIQKVLKLIRHSSDIDAKNKKEERAFTITKAIELTTAELLGRKRIKAGEVTSLLKQALQSVNSDRSGLTAAVETSKNITALLQLQLLSEVSEEVAMGAKMLSINRSLPNSDYAKFNYTQAIENFVNEKVQKSGDDSVFKLSKFVNDLEYRETWVDKYEGISSGLNILLVLSANPHIMGYLKAKLVAESLINTQSSIPSIVGNIINTALKQDGVKDKFKNATEDEYNAVVRHVEELVLSIYLKDVNKNNPVKLNGLESNEDLIFNLSTPHGIYAFKEYFPEYFERIKELNIDILKSNIFFNSLIKDSDAKGTYLTIKNLDSVGEDVKSDLSTALNRDQRLLGKDLIINRANKKVSYSELEKQIFLYSLIVGKGKVSKSSFFDLYEPRIKTEMGYDTFMLKDTASNLNFSEEAIKNNIAIASSLARFMPQGETFIQVAEDENGFKLKNRAEYTAAVVEDLPPAISLYYKNIPSLYILDVERNTYGLIQPIYPLSTVSANTDGFTTHVIKTVPVAKISGASNIENIIRGKDIELNVRFRDVATATTVVLKSPLGDIIYDRTKPKNTANTSIVERTFIAKSKSLDFEDTGRAGENKKTAVTILNNIIGKVKELFPNVQVELVTSESIEELFPEEGLSDLKGFVKNGVVYVNSDKASIDTPLHELGHVFLAALKETNPELYSKIIEVSLQENGRVATDIRKKYGELSEEELGEEIFVTLLGYKNIQDIQLQYTGKQSWVTEISRYLKIFRSYANDLLSNIMMKVNNKESRDRLSDLNISSASLGDLLSAVSFEMMNKDIKFGINSGDVITLKKSRNLSGVTNASELVNTLIENEDQESKKYEDKVVLRKRVEILKRFSNVNLDPHADLSSVFKENDNYEKDYILKLVNDLSLKENWNPKTDSIHYLNDLVGKTVEVKNTVGTPFKLDLSKVTSENPNIFIKVRNNFGRVEIEMYDISEVSENHYNRKTKRQNIASLFIDDKEARKLGISLNANQRDVNALRMGIIGMQIMDGDNNNLAINNLVSYYNLRKQGQDGDGPKKVLEGTTIETVIKDIKIISELPQMKGVIEGGLKKIIENKKLIDPKTYKGSLLDQYKNLVEMNIKNRMFSDTTRSKEDREYFNKVKTILQSDYVKRKEYDVLLDHLAERKKTLSTRASTGVYTKTEIEIIQNLILNLSGIRDLYVIDEAQTINSIQKFISGAYTTGNSLFDFVYEKLVGAMNSLRRTIMSDFVPKHNEMLDALMEDYSKMNPLSGVENYTINNAKKFFIPMLEKVKATDGDGESVEVFSGRLVESSDPKLTKAQKDYIDFFNETNKKSYNAASGSNPINSLIPLVKDTTGGILSNIAKSDKGEGLNTIKESYRTWVDSSLADYEYFYKRDKENESLVDDQFIGQFNPAKDTWKKYGNDNRLEILGLKYDNKGNLILTDKVANANFDKDLSTVLQKFTVNNYRKVEFSKVEPYISTMRNFVKVRNKAVGLGEEDHFDKTVSDYIDRFVKDSKSDNRALRRVNKVISKGSAWTAAIKLGLKPSLNLINYVTGVTGNFQQGMINTVQNKFMGDTGMFGAGDMLRANTINNNLLHLKKVQAINDDMGMYSLDIQHLLAKRQLSTDKGLLFNTKILYWMNFVGDVANRQILMTAQMLKDGSWDAYSLNAEGKLVYDETKDKRFSGKDGEIFKEELKKALKKEGGLDKDGKMLRGYDNKIRNSLKVKFDKIHGSYDNETSSGLNNYALGKAFLLFKKYMQNKINQYYTAGKGAVYSDIEGRYVAQTLENGEIVYNWEGSWNEGIFVSLWNLVTEVAKTKSITKGLNNLSDFQKKNLIHLGTDIVAFASIVALFGLGDDDDKKDESLSGEITRATERGTEDIFTSIVPWNIPHMLANPFPSVKFLEDFVNRIMEVITGGDNEDEGRVEAAQKIFEEYTPYRYVKSVQQGYKYIDDSEEEEE